MSETSTHGSTRETPTTATGATPAEATAQPATAAQSARELGKRVLRNPYLIGGKVRGANFYGRGALIEQLLDDNPRSIWIVGNRRIGKTSLLRRLEELGNTEARVAFYIDMQGTETSAGLTECFLDEAHNARLARLGLTIDGLRGKPPHEIMRRLDRHAGDRDLKTLLLLDEAEALFGIVDAEGDHMLKNLQRVMQDTDSLRIVLAATKRLLAMDKLCEHWDTSPFLDAVTPRYLGRLERDEALALICQAQSKSPQPVDAAVSEAIVAATGGHPYLTQWLCGTRLWSLTDGSLRAPSAEDLMPDIDMELCRMFELDYDSLSANEQRILREFAHVERLDEGSMLALLDGAQPGQVRSLASALTQLCYIQRVDDGYTIGNALLRNWLKFCDVAAHAPGVSDSSALCSADEEFQRINALLETHQKRLGLLRDKQARYGSSADPSVQMEIDDIQRQIDGLKAERARLRVG